MPKRFQIKSERIDIQSAVESIIALKNNIVNLAYRIDAMEMFISRVHQDMNTLETQLLEAEQDYPNKSENSLKSLLKPILSVSRRLLVTLFSIVVLSK